MSTLPPLLELDIEKVVFGGAGLARYNRYVLFIRDVLPQERVSVEVAKKKSHYAEAKLLKVLIPSAYRCQPRCPHAGVCGGCQLQHAIPKIHAFLKKAMLQEALYTAAPDIEIAPFLSSQIVWGWRRKIVVHARYEKGWKVGFWAFDNTTLIPIRSCLLFFLEGEGSFLKQIQTLVEKVPPDSLEISLFRLQSGRLALTVHGKKLLTEDVKKKLIQESDTFEWLEACSFRFVEWSWSRGSFTSTFSACGRTWHYSLDGFMQNHPELSEQLWQDVIDTMHSLGAGQNILDLYSGIGVTAISLASLSHNVDAVELSKEAVDAAKESAQGLDITFYNLCVEDFCASTMCLPKKYDSVIVNPPRAGLSKPAREGIIALDPKHILYVSCSPATLARDVAVFIQKGWKIRFVKGYDLFPQTTHFETMMLLNR